MQRFKESDKPLLIGYAADGFPIYGPYGYKKPGKASASLKKLKPSFRIKAGLRPGAPAGPGGEYTGVFVEDYEYVEGLGDLDATNGRFGITAEYPEGTYYYVISDGFPYIPRAFQGTPDASFFRHGPGLRRGPRPGFHPFPPPHPSHRGGPPPFGQPAR